MKLQALGIDLGKNVFHLVGLDSDGQVVIRKRCSRRQVLAFTANVSVGLAYKRRSDSRVGVNYRRLFADLPSRDEQSLGSAQAAMLVFVIGCSSALAHVFAVLICDPPIKRRL